MELKSAFSDWTVGKASLGLALGLALSFGGATSVDAATLEYMGVVSPDDTGSFSGRLFEGSPAIAKFDFGGGADFSTNWSGLDGDGVFIVEFADLDEDDDPRTVNFSFDLSSIPVSPGSDETLGVRFVTLKAATTFFGWRFEDALGELTAVSVFSGSVSLPDNFRQAISNVTFWDTGVPPGVIPLPAAGWLLVTGLGGLALLRRRKTA